MTGTEFLALKAANGELVRCPNGGRLPKASCRLRQKRFLKSKKDSYKNYDCALPTCLDCAIFKQGGSQFGV